MSQEFRLPDLGEGITEAQIIKLLVAEGDEIAQDQSLFEVETDKAAVEIPSPFSGKISKVHISEGQTVNVGDAMITIEGDAVGTAVAPVESKAPSTAPAAVGAAQTPLVQARRTTAPAAPAVRKFARELGLDIDSIAGTGPGGRVTKTDVQAAAAGPTHVPAGVGAETVAAAPVAQLAGIADADKWGPIRRSPMPQIRKTIANQMVRSATTIPHVTHMDQADITELEKLRAGYKRVHNGTRKVTAMSFLIRALCNALRAHPIFNASVDMEKGEILYKEYINIGIAVDTERGLVVPNIRNADRLSIAQIGTALAKIAENARKGHFAIDDLRGGTFTITNYGALGGLFGTPIINYPEAAILGIGRARPMPVVVNDGIVVRTLMPLSLSFDHRVADGAQAARFCSDIIKYLENPASLLL